MAYGLGLRRAYSRDWLKREMGGDMINSHRVTRGRPLAGLIALTGATLLMFAWAIFPSAAVAATTITWTGQGSENLLCSGSEHWVLSPAQGITSAFLTVRGVNYPMVQSGQGSFAVDTNVGVNAGDIGNVTATYEGTNTTAFIKLSHCNKATTTTPPTTPTTTTAPPSTSQTAAVLVGSAGFPASSTGFVLAGLAGLFMLTLGLRLASTRERGSSSQSRK
jgi:hypothetical protein